MSEAEKRDITVDEGCKDAAFIQYVESCMGALNTPDPQRVVASLTRSFVKSWQMPDLRFLQMRSDAPYASYLLYLSPTSNLSIVLDIFGPGQAAVAHNHRCWCVFGCLAGYEREQLFDVPPDLSSPPALQSTHLRHPGDVTIAGDGEFDFHQVECASETVSMSLHIYGADIGKIERLRWDDCGENYAPFRGGYCNDKMGLPIYYDVLNGNASPSPIT